MIGVPKPAYPQFDHATVMDDFAVEALIINPL